MYSYEQDPVTGLWHWLVFGKRDRGHHAYATEAEIRAAIAGQIESNRQADEDERRFHIQ